MLGPHGQTPPPGCGLQLGPSAQTGKRGDCGAVPSLASEAPPAAGGLGAGWSLWCGPWGQPCVADQRCSVRSPGERVARCVITLAVVSAPGLKRKFSRPCLRGWGSDRGAGTGCMRGFQGPLQGCGEQRPAPLHCDPEAPKTRAPLGGPTLAFNRRAWGWPSRAPRPAVRWGSGWGSGCQKHQLGLNYGFPGRFGQCQPQRVYRREL